MVDTLSIFPFEKLFPTGPVTKLFRLFRMPRLIKLIDVNRFKGMIKSFQTKNSNDQTILKQYLILYMYNIFRLIIIALMITYFIGCIFYFISDTINKSVNNVHSVLKNTFRVCFIKKKSELGVSVAGWVRGWRPGGVAGGLRVRLVAAVCGGWLVSAVGGW